MATNYKLHYWPGFPGRAEFVRILLEYVGAPYEDIARSPDVFAKVTAAKTSTPGIIHYAAPMLDINDKFSLSQTPVINAYLAKKHGLTPDGDKEWIATQIEHTVHDIVTECHGTHHPVDKTVYYEDQLAEAKRCAEVTTKKRLPNLLGHLEKCVETHGSTDEPYLFGKDICYVDLSIAQLLKGIEYAFPKNFKEKLSPSIPRLLALREAVEKCDNIVAYRTSDRCVPFKDGIFRRIPELDC